MSEKVLCAAYMMKRMIEAGDNRITCRHSYLCGVAVAKVRVPLPSA